MPEPDGRYLGLSDPVQANRPGNLRLRLLGKSPDWDCMNIGPDTILRAMSDGFVTSLDGVGAALCAGTNCGTCRSELAALIARHVRHTVSVRSDRS